MPGGELEPIGRSGPALSEVAAEMSDIFARVGGGQPVQGLRRSAAVAALRPSRGGGPTATLLTAAAAGLLGLGAGAFVIRMPAPQATAEAKVAIQSPPPAQPPAQPQASPPPVALALAAPSAAPAAQGAPVIASAPAKASPSPAKAAARARAKFRMKLARMGGARPAQAKPPIRLSVPSMPVAQPASCEQDAAGDDCRLAVVQADRHLRAVYQNAIRRGVSRDVLEDYRDRWSDLRDKQDEDPTRLIESYGALAYDLARENTSDEDDAARPRRHGGLKALADLLLPWR